MTDAPDFIPRFLLGLPTSEPEIGTLVVTDPKHVHWWRLAGRVPMGDRQPDYGATLAPSVVEGDVRVTTLTVHDWSCWIREDLEDLDTPWTCAILRDGRVELVDEATGYRAIKRNPARGPSLRAEIKARRDEIRALQARIGL